MGCGGIRFCWREGVKLSEWNEIQGTVNSSGKLDANLIDGHQLTNYHLRLDKIRIRRNIPQLSANFHDLAFMVKFMCDGMGIQP